MIRISFFPRLEEPGKLSEAEKSPRSRLLRSYCLGALFSGLIGFVLAQTATHWPPAILTEREFQGLLISANRLPDLPPVPVTLVEIDNPTEWSMLDLTLFLKALPTQNTPVTVIESLPGSGHPAWLRSFEDLALRQPRLVLPIRLSKDEPTRTTDLEWLEIGDSSLRRGRAERYFSMAEFPTERLQGVVPVGVVNLPQENAIDELPLLFWLNDRPLPSLALRAVLLARRISVESIRWKPTLLLGARPVATDRKGALPIDFSFLPGIRRLSASDFLLRLADTTAPASSSITDDALQGVLILGSISEKKYRSSNGINVSRSEIMAATIATLLNGPILRPLQGSGYYLLIGLLALIPWMLLGRRHWLRFFALIGMLFLYLLLAVHLAGTFGLGLPVVVPVATLLAGAGASTLLAFVKEKKHE